MSKMSKLDWAMGWTTGVRFPAGVRKLSRRHRVQTDYGAHPPSYQVGTGARVKAIGT